MKIGERLSERVRRQRDSSTPLRSARNDMWGSVGQNDIWKKGMDRRIGQNLRGDGAVREPPLRGMAGVGGARFFEGIGMAGGGWCPRGTPLRGMGWGGRMGWGARVLRGDWNDAWEKGMGSRPAPNGGWHVWGGSWCGESKGRPRGTPLRGIAVVGEGGDGFPPSREQRVRVGMAPLGWQRGDVGRVRRAPTRDAPTGDCGRWRGG